MKTNHVSTIDSNSGFSIYESSSIDLYSSALANSSSASVVPAISPTVITGAIQTASASVNAPTWIASLSDPVLKADMTAAAASGTVTEASMVKLFTDLGSELTSHNATLSASQFTDLKTIVTDLNVGESASTYLTYVTNALVNGNVDNATWTGGAAKSSALGNLATGSTATQLSHLEGKWLQGTDLPTNPDAAPYSVVSNPVFAASGPSMNDINQGDIGDCYLLPSLAEVAHQDPSAIQSMITNNGNNTYGVRFFVNGTPEYVTVCNSLAGGGNDFNSGNNIWGSLVEQAFVQFRAGIITTGTPSISFNNSFSTINLGNPAYALEEITGASAVTSYSSSMYSGGSTWNTSVLNSSLTQTSYASGLTTATLLSTLATDIAKGNDLVLSSHTAAYDSNHNQTLVASHAMSIYGFDSATGNLEIRNPWGTQAGQYWDTTFEVSLNTLLADGDTISADNIAYTAPNSAPSVSAQTASQSWVAGQKVSLTLPSNTFADPQGQTLHYSAALSNGNALPSWLTFNATTDSFTGTAPSTAQNISVVVTATDTSGLAASETFNIGVTAPKAPVLAHQTAAVSWAPNMPEILSLASNTFTDPQNEALTYKATLSNGNALPNWLKFNPATETFNANSLTAQSVNVLVTATDTSGLVSTETINIGVTAPKAPVLAHQTAAETLTINTTGTLQVGSSTFTDPQNEALIYKATLSNGNALPSWLTFNPTTETFNATTPSTAQSLTLTVTATDTSGLSSSETISFGVIVPKAPAVNVITPTETLTAGKAFSIALPANTFVDPNGLQMTYVAIETSATGGQSVSSWLHFDSVHDTFSGTAPTTGGHAVVSLYANNSIGLSTSESINFNFGSQVGLVGVASHIEALHA